MDSTYMALSEVEYVHVSWEGITVQSAPSLPCDLFKPGEAVQPDGSTVYVVGGDAWCPDDEHKFGPNSPSYLEEESFIVQLF